MSRRHIALAGGIGALYSAALPVVALLALQPADYGMFSVLYLLFALGLSVVLSLVLEVATRLRQRQAPAEWTDLSSTGLVVAALVGGVVAVAGTLFTSIGAVSAVFAVSAAIALYRFVGRFTAMVHGEFTRVIATDLAGLVGFALGMCAVFVGASPMLAVGIAWLLMSVLSLVGLRPIRFVWGRSLLHWLRRNGSTAAPLLADSVVMDLGAIGTPLVLAPMLGPAQFGIYRGISNVALPVRLIIDPVRPVIATKDPRRFTTVRSIVAIVGCALALGVACFAVLAWVIPMLPVDLGTLSALVPFAWPAAIFVVGSFIGHMYYVVARTHSTARGIAVGRVSQTVLVTAMPILGALASGLDGAIWGFSISAGVSAIVWAGIVALANRGEPALPE